MVGDDNRQHSQGAGNGNGCGGCGSASRDDDTAKSIKQRIVDTIKWLVFPVGDDLFDDFDPVCDSPIQEVDIEVHVSVKTRRYASTFRERAVAKSENTEEERNGRV